MTDSLASAEDRSIAEPSLSAVMSTIGSPACRLTCINDASELCARRAPATRSPSGLQLTASTSPCPTATVRTPESYTSLMPGSRTCRTSHDEYSRSQ